MSLMFMRRFFKLAVYQQVVVWILMKVMHQREISLTAFVSLVSSIFQPFLGPLAAAGIIKGIVAIMAACGLSATTSPMYVILNAAGDSVFQFLPILIALTSARRFKVNEFTAFAIAGALVYPDLATLVTLLFKRLIKGMF